MLFSWLGTQQLERVRINEQENEAVVSWKHREEDVKEVEMSV